MKKTKRRQREWSLAELEASVRRRAARARLLLYSLAGVSALLILINALTRSTDPHVPLAQRWWSLIVLLAVAMVAALLAAHELWLVPRRLTVHRWLAATRPLHAPLAAARAAEAPLLAGDAAALAPGRRELGELLEPPPRDAESAEIQRRVARLDAYRVALATLQVDALLQNDFVDSAAFRSGLETAGDLLRGGTPPREAPSRSIVVLPFADLSPLRDQEYFSHGLAEGLIDALTKVRHLRVIARGLAFSLAGQSLEAREVGRRLGVDAVLEGSVQKSGDRLRVTTRLVASADGRELWSGHFDEPIEHVFKIEDELAGGALRALGITPSSEERRAIEKPGTRVVGAYDYYLRGRRFFAQFRSRGMQFALQMFTRAIELDPGYARAHAGIADCCAFLYSNAGRSEEHREQALAASARALELDPELPEAHLSRGVALSQGGRAEEAGRFFETAVRLSPNLFEAHYHYARHLFAHGEKEKAIRFYESAARLRPEDYQVPLLSAQSYEDLGRADEAAALRRRGIHAAREHLELNPDDARALYMGANGMVSLGELTEGLEWARRSRELEPHEPMLLYNLACVYSLAGETEEALDCLGTGIDHGFSFRDWIEQDSNLDAIREHPAFADLMSRI